MASPQSALAQISQRITVARGRLERQRELIQTLAKSGDDTHDAEALFRTMRRTLEGLEEDRRKIEDETYSTKADGG